MSKHPPKKFRKTGKNKVRSLKPPSRQLSSTKISQKEKVVLDTLKYRQIFGCPMNIFQIWNYLLLSDKTYKHPGVRTSAFTPFELKQTLAQLVKAGVAVQREGLYSLKNVDYEKHEQSQSRARDLIIKAESITNYLKRIPWIEMVALTGDVAAFNADKNADIDMLIVTKPRRLFISRLFLVVILKTLRAYWNPKNPAGRVCPNIFLTSDSMTWKAKDQNIYTANEVSLLYPLYFNDNCYFKFLVQNKWVCDYLPNFAIHTDAVSLGNAERKHKSSVLVDFVEFVVKKFQLVHMRRKQTTEIITDSFLHFNINDKTPRILGLFSKIAS